MSEALYTSLASWYTLLTAPAEYEQEAAWYTQRILELVPEAKTVLELGCGVGANASFMKEHFEMTLVDLSEEMLAECATLNPELPRAQGDMRSVRLDQRFDVVFVHDAASYLLTEEDVEALSVTIAHHLRPGGVAIVGPDDLAETFEPGIESGGHDGSDGRGLRYLAWSVPGSEHEVITDYAYMLRHPDGRVELAQDRHITGRLPEALWRRALAGQGLRCEILDLEADGVEAGEYRLFRCQRPVA